MAKKTSRVTPPITKMLPKFKQYDDLNNGDAFLHEGALLLKCENTGQEAIDLDTGQIYNDMCDRVVEPVNITVAWTKKKK